MDATSRSMMRAGAALFLAACAADPSGGAGGAPSGGGGASTSTGGSVATSSGGGGRAGGSGDGGVDGSGGDGSGGHGGDRPHPTPEQCEAFTDEVSCLAGGCSLFERLRALRVDEDGACRYGAEIHLCIGWEHVGVAVGGAMVTGWYRESGGVREDVEGNAVYIGGLPGWSACDTSEPAEGACACAGRVDE